MRRGDQRAGIERGADGEDTEMDMGTDMDMVELDSRPCESECEEGEVGQGGGDYHAFGDYG